MKTIFVENWSPYRRGARLGQSACAPAPPIPVSPSTGVTPAAVPAPQPATNVPTPAPTFASPRGVNCQRTEDGGAICSDGVGYAPGCPKTPPINVPGVAGYTQQGTLLYPKPPPAPGTPGGDPVAAAPAPASVAAGEGVSATPILVGAGVLGALVAAGVLTGVI